MEVRPTPQKIIAVKEKIAKILFAKNNWFKIREVASLLGTLVDLTKGVDYGLAHYKNLERCKIWGQNFNKFMKISKRGFLDLQWWWHNISSRTRKILTTQLQHNCCVIYKQNGRIKISLLQ